MRTIRKRRKRRGGRGDGNNVIVVRIDLEGVESRSRSKERYISVVVV